MAAILAHSIRSKLKANIMKTIKAYKCLKCGKIFEDSKSCKDHECKCGDANLLDRIECLEMKIKSLEQMIELLDLKLKGNYPNYPTVPSFPPITPPITPPINVPNPSPYPIVTYTDYKVTCKSDSEDENKKIE